jgi:hypothetical protein
VTPLENLLARLPGAKKCGNGWSAPCPAHDDRRASLSIGQGDDGTLLVTCHAGCDTAAILATVGLTWADLFPPESSTRPHRNGKPKTGGKTFATANDVVAELERAYGKRSAVWTYHDAQGDPVGVVVRWDKPGGKDIRPVARCENGWRIGAMPEPRPLYGLPDLAAAPLVVVCEGEKATDSARVLGFVATTSAGGAQAAAKTDWRPLSGKEVWILPDNDLSGRKYAEMVVSLLAALTPAPRYRIVELPNLPEGGDVVDWIDAHGEAAEPEGMRIDIEALGQATPFRTPTGQSWPAIEPFDELNLPDFPTHALPEPLRAWVEAESHATQTPPDLAGMLALAVCSACIARRVVVEPRPGWREPVNLFAAVLLEPGNRKSAVFTDATKPLRDLEERQIELARPEVARKQSERRQAEARLKKLEKTAAEQEDDAAREDAGNLAVELAEQAEPVLPRLIVDDATSEKLGMMLDEQGGRIASMSPEGGVFDLMAGLYSKSGIPQFGVYLMGHSGDDLVTDRVSRKSVRVKRPALTCAYAMQPVVIDGLAGNVAFRGRGLLARFLYSAPKSWIGQRKIAPTPVSEAIRNAYCQVVQRVAELKDEHTLRLADDAGVLFQQWETEIEVMLAEGEQMELIRDWGAKLAGATLRLAAVLHCVEHGPMGPIDAQTIAAAIAIARYLIPHAEAVLNMMQANEESADDDACYVLRWIKRHGRREFTKSEAQHHGKRRFPKADGIDPALVALSRRGYIRVRPVPATGPGRPASPAFEVNPSVFANQKPEKRSQYSHNSANEPKTGNSGNNGSAFGQSENTEQPPTASEPRNSGNIGSAFGQPENTEQPTESESRNSGNIGSAFEQPENAEQPPTASEGPATLCEDRNAPGPAPPNSGKIGSAFEHTETKKSPPTADGGSAALFDDGKSPGPYRERL